MRYRKRPVTIEAWQLKASEAPGELASDVAAGRLLYTEAGSVLIATLEGTMEAFPGDWIIRGVEGELYPCKDSIFRKTYEPAPEQAT